MQDRSAESTFSEMARFIAVACIAVVSGTAESDRIVKPSEGSWLKGDFVEIIAKSADGRLLLDGKAIPAEEPFPGVLHARLRVASGQHSLRLETASGDQEVRFYAGNSPANSSHAQYIDHPPIQTECTHCHTVSRRGRFRFNGGCQTCHAKERFIQTHSHEPHELTSCGMCHDAHGSNSPKLLKLPSGQACKQCHN